MLLFIHLFTLPLLIIIIIFYTSSLPPFISLLIICLIFSPLPAFGCDQRLQFGEYAAVQLDSGHRGPQPQHCVQPHSLWVRTAGLSYLMCLDMFTSSMCAHRGTHTDCTSAEIKHFICLLRTTAGLSCFFPEESIYSKSCSTDAGRVQGCEISAVLLLYT